MPLKFSRAKGGDYYAPDKSRDAVGKQVTSLKLLSDDSSPSRVPYRDVCKPALKSTLSVIPRRTAKWTAERIDIDIGMPAKKTGGRSIRTLRRVVRKR